MERQRNDLTPAQLLQAYANGIFPMAPDCDSDDLDWYAPARRGIIPLDAVHLSRSLAKLLRQDRFAVTIDRDFAGVLAGCAAPRTDTAETWISPRIAGLYQALFASGHAHSVEVWQADELVGGAYGVALGRAFFGESMFSRTADASKVALAHLLARLRTDGFVLCDTQYLTPHLATFGGIEISRAAYERRLAAALQGLPASGVTFGAAPLSGAAVVATLSVAGGAAGGAIGNLQSTTVTS